MDPFDDYLDEMGRLSPHEVEAILSDRGVDHPAAERLAALISEVRRDLLQEPREDVAARHLAAMRGTAAEMGSWSAGTSSTRRESMRPIGQRRLAGLATAATLLLGVGVAAAVTLPDEASDTAKEAVSNDNAAHGQEVSDAARNTSLQGCEKGQAIADLASSKAAEHRQGAGPPIDPCARGNNGDGNNNVNNDGGSGVAQNRQGSGGGSGGPGGGGGGGGSQLGSGGGFGGPGGGGGGGGSQLGSGGGFGGPGGGGGGGGSQLGSGGGSGGPGGGSGFGGPGDLPIP